MRHKRLTPAEIKVLVEVYLESELAVDRLPYSEDFDAMWANFRDRTGSNIGLREFWLALMDARKDGDLPPKVKGRKKPAVDRGEGFFP